jgi:hypothetical protein
MSKQQVAASSTKVVTNGLGDQKLCFEIPIYRLKASRTTTVRCTRFLYNKVRLLIPRLPRRTLSAKSTAGDAVS